MLQDLLRESGSICYPPPAYGFDSVSIADSCGLDSSAQPAVASKALGRPLSAANSRKRFKNLYLSAYQPINVI
jgi:hypothetical protein